MNENITVQDFLVNLPSNTAFNAESPKVNSYSTLLHRGTFSDAFMNLSLKFVKGSEKKMKEILSNLLPGVFASRWSHALPTMTMLVHNLSSFDIYHH